MTEIKVVPPQEVSFASPVPLPASTRLASLVSVPLQGQTFGSGAQITFPLIQSGYLVPNSVYLCAQISFTHTTGNDSYLLGIPSYSFIQRVDCQMNSQVIESITGYGALSTMLLNSKCSIADKVALSVPLGLNSDLATPSFVNMDGYKVAAATATGTQTLQVAAPFGCAFTCAERFLPLSGMDARITLTVDDIANFSYNSGTMPSNLSITNVYLMYDVVQFDAQTDATIMSQCDAQGDIFIKSQSYQVSSTPLTAGSPLNIEIPYAASLTSIKSLMSLFYANSGNKWFASYDATGANGQLSYTISGKPYPETAINTTTRKPQAVLEYLASVWGTKDPLVATKSSLGQSVFTAVDANPADDSKINASKAYFGVNVERLSRADGALLTGVSSQNSNITMRLINNNAGGLASALNSALIVNYDLLFKINVATKQISTLR